jgi:hypothetical protein
MIFRLQWYQRIGWNGRFVILSAEHQLFYGDVLVGYALEVIASMIVSVELI